MTKFVKTDWAESTLGKVCEIKYGKDHKELSNGNIPCYGSGGLMRNVEKFLYDKPSVLIPRKGTISNLFFIEVPFWTVDTLFYTVINEEKIVPKFLFYKLKNETLEDLNVGSAVPSLTTNLLNEFSMLLPLLPEQKAIASVLSSLDDKIDLLNRQNKTLEAMAETLFREWFIEPCKDGLPEGWKEGCLGDVCEITSSKRIFYDEYVKEGVPFYRSKEIIELSDNNNISTDLFISENKFCEIQSNFGVPIKGDILLTSVGTLGRVYRVNYNDRFYFKDGNLTWFKNFKKTPSIIIYWWLKSSFGQELLNSTTIGSTQSALTISGLKSIPFLIPQQDVIDRLSEHLDVFSLKINENTKQKRFLEKTRDTLLPKLMSGEVRVEV